MAVDPFLQMYDDGELKVAAEFLTNWLPFLTGDLCDCCSATLRCRIGSLGPASAPPAISSSDPTCASSRGFVVTGWDADLSPVPTGWDTEPERSSGYDKTPPSSERVGPTGWGTEPERTPVPTGWESGLVPTPAPTGWDFDSVQTPAPVPTGWDSGLEKTPEPTGWFTEMVVVPTGWDVEPEIPIGPSAPAQRGEKVRISWADMAEEDELEEEEEAGRSERTPAPTGWDSGFEKTPEPTGWFTEMAVVPTGRDVEPEIPIGPSAPAQRGEKVRISWADMAEEDELEEEEEAGRSERTPAPTGWDSGLEKTPEPTGWFTEMAVVLTGRDVEPEIPIGPSAPAQGDEKVRMSWADMAQEEEEEARRSESSAEKEKPELSRDQREQFRFGNLQRKKDFICLERIKGKVVNVLQGLELHTGVFSAAEQKRIVDFVYELQKKGQNRELEEHTYSKPKKWMRGKGRETIQFGCVYNYAKKNGNLPGILRNVNADPLPPLFKVMIRRLVRWHVLPPSCVPDSCIVNIYEPDDCIPPHIDSHDFVRPFCTVSFLSECDILFGSELEIAGPGEFTGSFAIPLPVGSVLVLNGNGADVAKHCVPAVPTKRISITFRKMDERKQPIGFVPEPDLQNIQPLPYETDEAAPSNHTSHSEQRLNGSIKGNASRGREPMVKPEHDFLQGHSSDLVTPKRTPYHQDGDWESSSSKTMARGRNSVGRWSEPKPDQGLLGAPPHRADGYTFMERSPRPWLQDEGSVSWDGRSEQRGRRVYLDQKRLMISHNAQEENSFQDEERSSGHSGRRVMVEQKRMVISRDIAGEEEPARGPRGGGRSMNRRVRG